MIRIEEFLPEEVTKQGIRKKIWNYMEKHNLASFPRPVHGRIPNFKGCQETAQKLSTLNIFKSATTIKVNPDKPQEPVRFLTLEARKDLLVPLPRLRSGLFQHVKPPPAATKQELRVAASRRGLEEWGTPIGLDAKVKVDLVVLGSVAVSKEGYRIGKGEGYADLEFAMMMMMGAVTQETVVVSTVHDCQVFESLPAQLFKPHDVPVDVIITPTQVIEINSRLPKPEGIIWNLLSERKINEIPILQTLRKAEMEKGVDCTLKETDSDVEEHHSVNRHVGERYHARNKTRRTGHHDNNQESVDVGDNVTRKRPSPRYNATRQQSGENGAHESEGVSRKEYHAVNSRHRPVIEFSLRVSNIASDVRVRDLKAALAEKGVKPSDITWRGHRGFAYLHFAKARGSETATSPSVFDSIVSSLQDLRLGTETAVVEPAKPITRIEVTDISSV